MQPTIFPPHKSSVRAWPGFAANGQARIKPGSMDDSIAAAHQEKPAAVGRAAIVITFPIAGALKLVWEGACPLMGNEAVIGQVAGGRHVPSPDASWPRRCSCPRAVAT